MTRDGLAATLLALLTGLVLLAVIPHRAPLQQVWADEGTYLAMTESLVRDGDLRFGPEDRERLKGRTGGRATVILERGEGGISYSKPILLTLVTAPAFAVFGDAGLVVVNALFLALSLWLAAAYLRRLGSPGRAALVLVTFAGAAVLLPYVFWRMSDALQVALALSGLSLSFATLRPPSPAASSAQDRSLAGRLLSWRGAPYLGMALLGLLVSMRVSNVLIAAVPVLAALIARRFRLTLALALSLALPLLGLSLLTEALTDYANPYRAQRTSFTADTGYPVGDQADAVLQRFEQEPAAHSTNLRPRAGLQRVGLASMYFLVGRHTSLIFYFPAAVMLLLWALRRPDAATAAALLGFAATQAFFLAWYPWNYFGGETFLGNRYLLPLYPLLLVAPSQLPKRRWLAAAWLVAFVSYGSALTSAARAAPFDRSSQNHAHAGIFRLLPYESTAITLAGWGGDRYWAGHLVRFVDPYAEVHLHDFELVAGRPATELMMAEWRPLEGLELEVRTEADELTLHFEDDRRRVHYELGAKRSGRVSKVRLEPAPAWRQHPFWWNREVSYDVRTFRLRLSTPDGSPARARIRYLGDPDLLEDSATWERLEWRILAGPNPGSTAPARLRVRNRSKRVWEHRDSVPVRLRYRLYRRKQRDEPAVLSPLIRLPHRVFPGDEVELSFPIQWPQEGGRHILEVDLEIPRLGEFAQYAGKPVVRESIKVRSPKGGGAIAAGDGNQP